MTYEVLAEVPDDREGVITLVSVRAQSFTAVWLKAEEMKAQGWKILSTPAPAEFPNTFPVEWAA